MYTSFFAAGKIFTKVRSSVSASSTSNSFEIVFTNVFTHLFRVAVASTLHHVREKSRQTKFCA